MTCGDEGEHEEELQPRVVPGGVEHTRFCREQEEAVRKAEEPRRSKAGAS